MQLSDPLWQCGSVACHSHSHSHCQAVEPESSVVLLTLDISVVDAGQAGEGNLEILVTAGSGINIPTRVEPLGGARFNVTFCPRTADIHHVLVTFNDEAVQGKMITITPTTTHEQHPHCIISISVIRDT